MHAHVLAGLDDGPKTWQDAEAVWKQAVQDGTRTIVAVAHANDNHFEVQTAAYHSALARARSMIAAQNLPLALVPAMEVRLGPDLAEGYLAGRYLPIGDSRYLCVELPPNDFPAYTLDVLYQLTLEGLRILLIHPERNRGVRRRPELAERLMRMEILGVASAGSVLGQFGPEVEAASLELMESGLIQSVASDGHSVAKRPLRLSPVVEMLSRRFGEEETRWMMEAVPALILQGRPVELAPRKRLGWHRWIIARR
nr:CpsB/CapC family capsule biosynthesis tyrosine phosphatase [Sulfobacillus harzensis]